MIKANKGLVEIDGDSVEISLEFKGILKAFEKAGIFENNEVELIFQLFIAKIKNLENGEE